MGHLGKFYFVRFTLHSRKKNLAFGLPLNFTILGVAVLRASKLSEMESCANYFTLNMAARIATKERTGA